MLQLPNVTLVVIETRVHKLAKLAIDACLRQVEFGDVIIYSNNFDELKVPGAQHCLIDDWGSKTDWVRFCYYGTAKNTKTSHQLFVEWDAGIFDPTMWSDSFLEFDYIGAPWGYKDNHNVGNGGFCLRSKRLMQFLADHRDEFSIQHNAGDGIVCRDHRGALETQGFKWPGNELALDFAFENIKRHRNSRHFGFHEVRNWPLVLEPADLEERLQVARANDYVIQSSKLNSLYGGLPHYIDGYDEHGHWKLGVG